MLPDILGRLRYFASELELWDIKVRLLAVLAVLGCVIAYRVS